MGAYTELVDFTFTADETSRTFSGLNITKDDFIKIVFTHVNTLISGSNTAVALYPNTTASVSGFDTATNYHRQFLQGNGSSTFADRGNNNFIVDTPPNKTNFAIIYFKISENGKSNSFSTEHFQLDSDVRVRFLYTTSSNLTFSDPITALTFTGSETNGLGTGSRIQIYRLDAVKEADITTTENATQVDISSLSIGKDSEYLLVSDLDMPNAGSSVYLCVNDNTTLTDYYRQRIRGDGSTASANRVNSPEYAAALPTFDIAYTHIKLSEIGAFTFQSYTINNVGTSSIRLENYFGSSVAENITSITKLNIISQTTDNIQSGTRFQLYKLK